MQTRPTDEVFRALADRRRRLVVRYLMNEADGVASYREVTDALASEDAQSAAIPLTHTILPILKEAEIVDYDPERERIRYRPNELVEDALRVVDGR
ncbi:DUF7344 domain-containing protein [Haloplanus sp. C73]|uniref:DUF7344 domain-containing protein n=1 Tax=Haloplanus sp. C73 TaxID=3421641 RepID=UPI003EB9B248